MKIVILIGGIILYAFAGFAGLGFYAVCLLMAWYILIERGLLFIRSYLYLTTLRDTKDETYANQRANSVGVFDSRAHYHDALFYASMYAEGRQLEVINAAKEFGYQSKGLVSL
ncbi:MAG: hypothetical protein CL565_06435 [Alphaproteobacteria bacterium]|nr:hypothetical protein [Alphaproteobacteria bacterium]